MGKVLCRDCIHYDNLIHSCARLDREAGDFVSHVFDECWCTTKEGAREMTVAESIRKYGPEWRSYRKMESQTNEEIETRFTYHAPKAGQPAMYTILRNEAKSLAYMIEDMCPESEEKSIAMTKLDEVVMWANAAIARRG